MLIEDGLLRRENGGWTVADEVGELPVPPTIHALLAARLERLPENERALLAHASIEGTVFHRGALDELAPGPLRAVVEGSLTSLVRRDMICPDRASFAEDEAYRFRHILIRDAGYRSLSKEMRAALHERFADWLERDRRLAVGRVRGDRRLPPRAGVPPPERAGGDRLATPRCLPCAERNGSSRPGARRTLEATTPGR